VEVDAVVVAADAEAANNKSQLSDPKPLIHGPLFMDFVGCYLPTCHEQL